MKGRWEKIKFKDIEVGMWVVWKIKNAKTIEKVIARYKDGKIVTESSDGRLWTWSCECCEDQFYRFIKEGTDES
jgi:hypothetical protein